MAVAIENRSLGHLGEASRWETAVVSARSVRWERRISRLTFKKHACRVRGIEDRQCCMSTVVWTSRRQLKVRHTRAKTRGDGDDDHHEHHHYW